MRRTGLSRLQNPDITGSLFDTREWIGQNPDMLSLRNKTIKDGDIAP